MNLDTDLDKKATLVSTDAPDSGLPETDSEAVHASIKVSEQEPEPESSRADEVSDAQKVASNEADSVSEPDRSDASPRKIAPAQPECSHKEHSSRKAPKNWQFVLLLILATSIAVPLSICSNKFACDRLSRAGAAAISQGRLDDAERLFQKAVNEAEKFGFQNRTLASRMCDLAEVYRLKCDYKQAEILHNKALRLRLQLFGEDFPDVATSLIGLGLIKEQCSERADAEACYLRAIAISKKCGSTEGLASALVRLASLRLETNHFDSLTLAEQALQIQVLEAKPNEKLLQETLSLINGISSLENLPPPSMGKVIDILSSKPGLEQEITEFTQQLLWNSAINRKQKHDLYERAMKALEAAAKRGRLPSTGTLDSLVESLVTLDINVDQGHYIGAAVIPIFERELALLEAVPTKDRILLLPVLTKLVNCDNLPLARRIAYSDQAIKICERHVHENATTWKPDGVNSMLLDIQIPDVYRARMALEPERSAQIRQQELQLWERECGPHSVKLAARLIETAPQLPTSSERQTYYNRAVSIFREYMKSIDTPTVVAGPNKELIITRMFYLITRSHNRFDLQSRREFLSIVERIAGPDHPFTGKAFKALADEPSLPKAERLKLCRQALKIWRQFRKGGHTANEFWVLTNDGPLQTYSILLDRNEIIAAFDLCREVAPAEAESIIKEKANFCAELFGANSMEVAQAYCELGELPTLPDHLRIKYFERAISMCSKHDIPTVVYQAFQGWTAMANGKYAETALRKQLKWVRHKNQEMELASVLSQLADLTKDADERKRFLEESAYLQLEIYLRNTPYDLSESNKTLSQLAQIDEELLARSVTKALRQTSREKPNDWSTEAVHLTNLANLDGIPMRLRLDYVSKAAELWEQPQHLDREKLEYATQTFSKLAILMHNAGMEESSVWDRAIRLCTKHAGDCPEAAICINRMCASIQQHCSESKRALSAAEIRTCTTSLHRALGIWNQQALEQLRNDQLRKFVATTWMLAQLVPAEQAETLYQKAVTLIDTIGDVELHREALSKLCVHYANNNKIDKAEAVCELMRRSGHTDAATDFKTAVRQLARPSIPGKNVELTAYLACLSTQINDCWTSEDYNERAMVRITFLINANGGVSNIRVVENDGGAIFAQAGVHCISNAAPFLRLPGGTKPQEIDWTFSQ